MNNKTIIKEKKNFSSSEIINVILAIVFSILSLGIGFVIAYFGKGESYVETELINAIITLFGFGLTATVFVYQALENKRNKDTVKVIKSISTTLIFTLCLIVCSLVFDFALDLITSEKLNLVVETLKYATMVYSVICQFDILISFIVIIKSDKKEENKRDE